MSTVAIETRNAADRADLRTDWSREDQDRPLPSAKLKPARLGKGDGEDDPRVAPVVAALSRNRRVDVQSSEPAEALMQSVWRKLPGRTRRRIKAASWVFGNANGFDFLAAPRLGSLGLDGAELVLAADSPPAPNEIPPARSTM